MVKENHLDPLEDSRFKEIKRLKKKHTPHQLHWYLKEDYFSEELLGVYSSELHRFKQTSIEAFELFEKATERILQQDELHFLNIPPFFKECIEYSWQNKEKSPFFYGRFDLNGGFNNTRAKVIEFNADTCSTIPETLLWQPLQLQYLKGDLQQFNSLSEDMSKTLSKIKHTLGLENPSFLSSTFGYQEDIINANCINDVAYRSGYQPFYCDLEKVVFSEEEGIFYEIGGEYQPVDVWFKIIPWDWMFRDEPELAKTVSKIIQKDLSVVLNPSYTAIWQNKKFLAYITKHFPNNVIAETYLDNPGTDHVVKPVYGRLGENVSIQTYQSISSKGDYGNQEKVYQRYYPLIEDKEAYFYQTGIFYTHRASAINFRAQESKIITDDCEFMSHYLL